MAETEVDGIRIAYEILGDSGPTIILTPGGRFSKDILGLRPLAEALSTDMKVVIWDRPNCGASGVAFTGDTESDLWADALAGLLRNLDLAPAIVAGGSGGARVSLLTAMRHPDVVSRLAVWWISGGLFGTMALAGAYCVPFISTALNGGMDAVAKMPQWAEVVSKNPANADTLRSLDTDEFIAVMLRWLRAFVPQEGAPIPGTTEADFAKIVAPTMIIRNGSRDYYHPEETSLAVHKLINGASLVEPPWAEDEYHQGSRRRADGTGGIFDRWLVLAPMLRELRLLSRQLRLGQRPVRGVPGPLGDRNGHSTTSQEGAATCRIV